MEVYLIGLTLGLQMAQTSHSEKCSAPQDLHVAPSGDLAP